MPFLTLSWTPKIGDPSIMGWITVVFYFITSALSLSIALLKQKERTSFRFWGLLAIFLLLLGINKQLDIQSLFTEIGRAIAKEQGWYTKRRSVQFLFIIMFGIFSFSVIITIWWMLRKRWRQYLIPLTGFLILVSFIIIRAASFHHFDMFLRSGPAEIRMNWILELGGIGIIFLAGILKLLKI